MSSDVGARDRSPWGTFEIRRSHLSTGPLSTAPGTTARAVQQVARDLQRATGHAPRLEHIRPAARTIARHALDSDDCHQLLDMLGLLEELQA